MSRYWLLGISLLCMGASHAEESVQPEQTIEVTVPLETEVEFGYQAHTGNTDSRSLNARLSAEYTSGRHRSMGEWKYYNLYKNGEEDKRSSTYTAQSDYKLGTKTYLYGSFKGVDSRYSAYFKDYTLSGGLGYQFAYTEDFTLEVEIGPGFRYQEPNLDEIDDDDIVFSDIVQEAIFRGNINTTWHALDNLSFGVDVTMVSGKSNTRIDSDISIINNITEDIALKLEQSRQYHDRVPEGLSKADSVFSVNLLFIF
ncbi:MULTISPECIES: DUF481 domain-containing protein [Vibrio]|uniref:DUF481 domain-containing protein n=1 Tax=Vibrio TaxID=662 RepID=UPI000BFFBB5F|nr:MULTISPECIES: DUF481 domain-containing protein [unclassified Vibrio]